MFVSIVDRATVNLLRRSRNNETAVAMATTAVIIWIAGVK